MSNLYCCKKRLITPYFLLLLSWTYSVLLTLTCDYKSGIQVSGIQMVVQYSDHHLNTGDNLLWYSNGIQLPDHWAIRQLF